MNHLGFGFLQGGSTKCHWFPACTGTFLVLTVKILKYFILSRWKISKDQQKISQSFRTEARLERVCLGLGLLKGNKLEYSRKVGEIHLAHRVFHKIQPRGSLWAAAFTPSARREKDFFAITCMQTTPVLWKYVLTCYASLFVTIMKSL